MSNPSSAPQRRPHWHRHGALLLMLAAGHAPFAAAHADHAGGGLVAGMLHPLGGAGHLLAMVTVGLWGAVLGAPLVWLLPVAFPLLMVIGGVLGIAGIAVPYVEVGIALSVVVLGLAVACAWRAPRAAALGIVALFALLHGYAHGVELPRAAAPAAFATGFVLTTGLLHVAGACCGWLARGATWLRVVGAAIALTGAALYVEACGLA